MRAFIAIEMPEDSRRVIAQLQQAFASVQGIRLTRPEQCHLTLKFLGEIDEPRYAAIQDELGRIRAPAFRLALTKLGVFPDAQHARVIWVGVTRTEELERLARAVDQASDEVAADKPFTPHITIARVNSKRAALDPTLLEAKVAECTIAVAGFACYESKLTPAGSKHTLLRRFDLVR